MSEPIKPKSTIAKLAEVMGEVERVAKRGTNQFHKYDYATEADIAQAVRGGMAMRSLMMVPNVIKVEWEKVKTASGKEERLATIAVRFDLRDGDNDGVISFEIHSQGQDSGDKALFKAMTGATKYALLKLFLIPTGDDPENEDSPATKAPPPPAGVAALKARVAPRASPPAGPPEPPPHGDSEAPPQGGAVGRPEAVTFRFGNSKGKTSRDVSSKDLDWYIAAAQRSVEDPSKERFAEANRAELEKLQAEAAWRAGA